ncbi:MAG TPA: hypothetical protein VF503_08955 [Sphingobium sp.]|uniref:hypothetical protein n=1 Tax=Sphingobium sp. TaxID=1912891 RepID=UPI002ED44BFA
MVWAQAVKAMVSIAAIGLMSVGQAQTSRVPSSGVCHFPQGIAIGCADGGSAHAGQNAVTLYRNYGVSYSKLSQDYVRLYANQFQCGVVKDSRYIDGLSIEVLGKYRAIMPDGLVPIARVKVSAPGRGVIFWLDQRYLVGNCPRLSPNEGGDPLRSAKE